MNYRLLLSAIALSTVFLVPLIQAQDESSPSSTAERLSEEQAALVRSFTRLEMMMLKMAEVDSAENPRRAALLKKAFRQSKEKSIKKQMEVLVKVLEDQKLRRAIQDQTKVRDDLKVLLELLESENRVDRLKSEQSRVRQYIRELQRIIRQHKSVQGRTEGGADTERLAKDQEKVADRARRLAKLIDENELAPDDDANSDSDTENKRPSENGKDKADQENPEDRVEDPDSSQRRSNENGLDEKQSPRDADSPSENERVRVATKDGKVREGKLTRKNEESIELESDNGDKETIKTEDIEDIRLASDKSTESSDSSDTKGPDPKSDSENNRNSKDSGKNSSQNDSENSQLPGSEKQPNNQNPSDSQNQQTPSGQPSPGQNQPGENSNQNQQQNPNSQQQQDYPGRKRIEAAQERMKEAQEKLEEAERNDAIEDQREARELLEQAKAELEEILRQLREEEVERALTALESRFRKMLAMQINVYEDTQELAAVPAARRNNAFDIRSAKLSQEERKIVTEADRAIILLAEEGSSVAFPEATQQIRDDMEQIAERLTKSQVGELTQDYEQSVIEALEEMVAALQKARKDAEERKNKPQQQQSGQPQRPQDQPLVDAIAELKMIRALQLRVNKRTKRLSRLLADTDDPVGQATDLDLIESLNRLADREERIRQITHDIVLGKTK